MSYANSALPNELAIAREIFERRVGYRVFRRIITEKVPYGHTGAELKHTPVIRLLSVQARGDHYHDIFGQTDWVDIPLNEAILHQKDNRAAVTLPPTLFGTTYNEVKVTYEAGLTEIPEDIEEAIHLIADGIRAGEIDPASGRLPVQALEVISRHRKGA